MICEMIGLRWGASASEVIFVNKALATFWSLGKVTSVLLTIFITLVAL